jgi:glycerol-3-phosphate dehydrogenase
LVNASGPWVDDVIRNQVDVDAEDRIRLVRGSHIVTARLFDHDQPYIFQQSDGRIIFAIPYETDFTLIGTTESDHDDDPGRAVCTSEERTYLCRAASEYFRQPVTEDDVVWSYSGVRPLYDDGASSATQATRDYVLKVVDGGGEAPLLNVFGGKITTYRRLAESALAKLAPYFPEMGEAWTAGAALPGGDFPVDGVADLIARLRADYSFLDQKFALRLVRAYGTEAAEMLGDAASLGDLGLSFGWNLAEREVCWLMAREWARSADDVLWRRSKLGLRLTKAERDTLDAWMRDQAASSKTQAAVRASG